MFCTEVIFIRALRFLASSREEIGGTLIRGRGALSPAQPSITLPLGSSGSHVVAIYHL